MYAHLSVVLQYMKMAERNSHRARRNDDFDFISPQTSPGVSPDLQNSTRVRRPSPANSNIFERQRSRTTDMTTRGLSPTGHSTTLPCLWLSLHNTALCVCVCACVYTCVCLPVMLSHRSSQHYTASVWLLPQTASVCL